MRNSLVKTANGTDSFWFITVASLPRRPQILESSKMRLKRPVYLLT